MSNIDKQQLKIFQNYINKDKSILEVYMYKECIECGELFKCHSKSSFLKRKFCDSCRELRNEAKSNITNKDIGWKPYQQKRYQKQIKGIQNGIYSM